MEIFLSLMDPGTRSEILAGKGLHIERFNIAWEITAEEARDLIGQFTAREKYVAKVMSAIINGQERAIAKIEGIDQEGLGNRVNAVSRRLFGLDMAHLQNYWHRERKDDSRMKEPNQWYRQWQQRFLEQQGHWQPRARSEAPVVIRDAFQTFDRLVRSMSATASRMAVAHDSMRIITNKAFRDAVTWAFPEGEKLLKLLERDLMDWVSPARTDILEAERLLGRGFRVWQVYILGVRPKVAIYQVISLAQAALEIPQPYLVASGLLQVSNKDTRGEIKESWPLGWARITGSGHDIMTPFSGSSRLARELGVMPLTEEASEAGMYLIHGADTLVMYRIWRACKLWAQADGFTGDALMRETARRAQHVVDYTQPSWDIGTVSGWQKAMRKRPSLKFVPGLMFSSQRNQNAQIVIRETSDWASDEFSSRSAGRYIARTSVPTLVQATALAIISGTATLLWDALWRGLTGAKPMTPDERRKKKEETWWRFLRNVLSRTWGNWLVIGAALDYLMYKVPQWWKKLKKWLKKKRG
jgi:hypothetical protein